MSMIKTRLLKFLLIAFLITYFCWGGLALFVKRGFFTFTHPFGTFPNLALLVDLYLVATWLI